MYMRIALGLLLGAVIGGAMGYFGQCSSGTCPLTATWWRGAMFGSMMGLAIAASTVQPHG